VPASGQAAFFAAHVALSQLALSQFAKSHCAVVVDALTFFDLLQPTTANPRTAIRVSVTKCFIVIFSKLGVLADVPLFKYSELLL
jgi:hypothetical protein